MALLAQRPSAKATLLLALICGLLLAGMLNRYLVPTIEWSPDSLLYQNSARNLMLGHGYKLGIISPEQAYHPRTVADLKAMGAGPLERPDYQPPLTRPPGYPLMLTAIYHGHGVDLDRVQDYHLLLVGLTGFALAIFGAQLLGWPGLLAAVFSVILLGNSRGLSYPVAQLVSETLAMFLLTASAAAAAWAMHGHPRRLLLVGVFISLAILTRAGLIFTGLIFGIMLLCTAGPRWQRAVWYALPCVLLLGSWIAYISIEAGRFIPIAENGPSNIAIGMNPIAAADVLNRPKPEISVAGLHDYWRSNPGFADEDAKRIMRESLADLPTLAKVFSLKPKSATHWMPTGLVACSLLGFALLAGLRQRHQQGPQLFTLGLPVVIMLASLNLLMVLGFSTTWLQAIFWTLTLWLPWLLWRPGNLPSHFAPHPHWLLAWFWGFLVMILLTFGIRRFSYPITPIFYYYGVIALPLLGYALYSQLSGQPHRNR